MTVQELATRFPEIPKDLFDEPTLERFAETFDELRPFAVNFSNRSETALVLVMHVGHQLAKNHSITGLPRNCDNLYVLPLRTVKVMSGAGAPSLRTTLSSSSVCAANREPD